MPDELVLTPEIEDGLMVDAATAVALTKPTPARLRKFDTIAVHGGYDHAAMAANQGSLIEPLYLTSAQHFPDSATLAAVLAYESPGWAYSRISNPTVAELEARLALLETYGSDLTASACAAASGMAAVFLATNPLLAGAGRMNIVASAHVYGGTFMLFAERYGRERGIEIRWVTEPGDLKAWERVINKQTRFVYAETPSNPSLAIVDVAGLAELAHASNAPLIIDSTLATPALFRPLTVGADVVVHSLTKTMSANGLTVGGAFIARHNLISSSLDSGYRTDYATQVKLLPARDFGPALSPFAALTILSEIRTLRSRVNVLSQRTQKVADWLALQPAVAAVWYPGLANFPGHELAKQQLRLVDSESATAPAQSRYGHLLGFTVKGGAQAARRVLDRLQLICRATDLGRIKSVATIPAISTHQQQGDAGRKLATIPDNLIRLSVGAEHPDDVLADLDQALG